ncbi:MAG TPA: class I SAM-dependent methyltransferase [Ktedonobacterales bacterium]|nr:class I SAM-dependent methyltransferase [Ktedonobacterales bacterium]
MMPTDPNTYSPLWFDLFLTPIAPEQTAAEIAFISRLLPLAEYADVLDLCCGSGRHALPLAERGYHVTGVDRAAPQLALARREAQRRGLAARFIQADMADAGAAPGPFGAVLSLWQSFGYGDAAANAALLRSVRDLLVPRGRVLLDIYHAGFFAAHLGARRFAVGDRAITETKALAGDRLTVTLDYGADAPADRFEWQVFTPETITTLAAVCGLRPVLACAGFDEHHPPSAQVPRMQLLFARAT